MAKKQTKKTDTTAHAENLEPAFAELQHTGDPVQFKIKHPSDTKLYDQVVKNLLQEVPKPRTPDNLVLTLEEVLGSEGKSMVNDITKSGKIIFHAVGDTGSTKGPKTEAEVIDKMVNDFGGDDHGNEPSFCFHLGDVVYSFGEGRYYYDQFYDPFRDYPAPILAIPGNHDGLVYKGDNETSLEAFLRNFVTDSPELSQDSMGLRRTTVTQPGVYFALDAPFVTIIGLYSNVLEDPGIISSQGGKYDKLNDDQLTFLTDQLKRVKDSGKAVLVAVHHPPYTGGSAHNPSPELLNDLDTCCKNAGSWPHAFLSGHAHNYQRFTRTVGKFDVPYIVCGNSGHNVSRLTQKNNAPIRTPKKVSNEIIFENYDDKNYGYLRIIVDKDTLRIEYHDDNPDQKTDSDAVTVQLKDHTMISN